VGQLSCQRIKLYPSGRRHRSLARTGLMVFIAQSINRSGCAGQEKSKLGTSPARFHIILVENWVNQTPTGLVGQYSGREIRQAWSAQSPRQPACFCDG